MCKSFASLNTIFFMYSVFYVHGVTWPELTSLLCVRRGRPVHGARRVPREPVRHLCPECGGPGRSRLPAHSQPSLPGSHPKSSVPDPDPPDPHVFWPPESGSGSISQRYGSGSNIQKNFFKIIFICILKVNDENRRIRIH